MDLYCYTSRRVKKVYVFDLSRPIPFQVIREMQSKEQPVATSSEIEYQETTESSEHERPDQDIPEKSVGQAEVDGNKKTGCSECVILQRKVSHLQKKIWLWKRKKGHSEQKQMEHEVMVKL